MSEIKNISSNVIQLKAFRAIKEEKKSQYVYQVELKKMDKAQLLQALLDYHEAYRKSPTDMTVTIRAQFLMDELESRAHLSELKELSQELNAKLKARLYQQMVSSVT